MSKSLFALSLIGLASTASAASSKNCAPTPPATCYPSDCRPCHCLGPENYGVNAPVGPKTCNGDFFVNVSGFYWNAHQDGLEYAIRTGVESPDIASDTITPPEISSEVLALNNLVDAKYQTPKFNWDFGFKAGIGYTTTCDSWDIGVLWTWYKNSTHSKVEAEASDNQSLIALWAAGAGVQGSIGYVTNASYDWRLELNLVDIELGREFWTSKYLSIRPHIGLRIASIKQDFELWYRGGALSERTAPPVEEGSNYFVDNDNDFKGVGIRTGLDSEWNLGCGWAVYGNLAASIVYGKFSVEHDEWTRAIESPHSKHSVLDTDNSFRASRGMIDLGLGIQWSTMLCECSYGFTARLGWEQHLFFHQNQMWRVVRNSDVSTATLPNNTGENIFHQRRGNLDTQGWTLSFKFEF